MGSPKEPAIPVAVTDEVREQTATGESQLSEAGAFSQAQVRGRQNAELGVSRAELPPSLRDWGSLPNLATPPFHHLSCADIIYLRGGWRAGMKQHTVNKHSIT